MGALDRLLTAAVDRSIVEALGLRPSPALVVEIELALAEYRTLRPDLAARLVEAGL